MRENKAWIHVWKRQMDLEICVCVCVPVCVCVLEWRWDWQCAYLLSSFSVYLWNLLCICLWSPLSVSLSIHLCLFVPLFLTLLCLFVPISPSPPTSISPPKHCHGLQNSQIISNTEQTHSFQHRDSERVFQMCVQSVSNLTWLNKTQTEDKRMLCEHWWQTDYPGLVSFYSSTKITQQKMQTEIVGQFLCAMLSDAFHQDHDNVVNDSFPLVTLSCQHAGSMWARSVFLTDQNQTCSISALWLVCSKCCFINHWLL